MKHKRKLARLHGDTSASARRHDVIDCEIPNESRVHWTWREGGARLQDIRACLKLHRGHTKRMLGQQVDPLIEMGRGRTTAQAILLPIDDQGPECEIS